MSSARGTASELDVRSLAAELGVRDFVYHPVVVPKGSASREVGDGLLIVGDRGVILQVKARDSEVQTDEKIASWIEKHVVKAVGQVLGTRRTLQRETVTLKSLRGNERTLAAGSDFPGVVLLDLDRVPVDTPVDLDDPRSIAMTVQDWRALNGMIRSTSGVIDYVERAVAVEAKVNLGDERVRYHAFAEADRRSTVKSGLPILPLAALDPHEAAYVDLVAEWIDSDLAVSIQDPDHVRMAVEMLDEIPVLGKVRLGKVLLDRAAKCRTLRRPVSGSLRLAHSTNRVLFHFDLLENWGTDDLEERLNGFLLSLVTVRHEEFDEAIGQGRTLLLSRLELEGSAVARTVSLVDGLLADAAPTPEVRWAIRERFGTVTTAGARDVKSFGRNERCPCGSDAKYKYCHGQK